MAIWQTAGKVRMTPKGVYNSSTAYEILDIVSNTEQTISYIAKQAVPAGTALTNTTYWAVIADVTEALENADAAISYIGDSYSSSSTYGVGDYVIHDGGLYRCKTTISTAEAWTAAHWEQVSAMDEIQDVKDDVADLKSALIEEQTARQTEVAELYGETSGLRDAVDAETSRASAAEAANAANISRFDEAKVPFPISPASKYGTSGQLLRTLGNGSTEWVNVGLPTDEQTEAAITTWLEEHPEATTTVQDGSLTEAKFSEELYLKTIKDYVTPEMFGAKGNGVNDDTAAIQAAIDYIAPTGGCVLFSAKTYAVDSVLISSNNVTLRGVKASTPGTGTVLVASTTSNTGAMIRIESSSMRIGGGIFDLALMGNNARQTWDTGIAKVGIEILNRAEFVLENVFVSGFKNGGLFARDWWDSNVIGLEVRACGIADTAAAVYLGSENDSCNSLHFFGAQIEESPFQLHIDNICSHIQFVASKFEGGRNYGEPNVGTHFILIYEGVYSVTFDSCFFSGNANTIWVDVRNNLTVFTGCHFATGIGTIIKNYSSNATYGKGVIITGCEFEKFGKGAATEECPYSLHLNSGAIMSNNHFECNDLVRPIYIAGSNNSICGNVFQASNLANPLFNLGGTLNKLRGNQYLGCQKLWTGAGNNNELDNKSERFVTRSTIAVDFSDCVVANIVYNGDAAVTLSSADIQHATADATLTIYSVNKPVTMDTSLVVGGTIVAAGKAAMIKYVSALSKFVLI